MNIKDKLLNILADKLKGYQTKEYDKVLSCDIKAEVKGAFMTVDCTIIKEMPEKSKSGLIDMKELLDTELDNGDGHRTKEIIFCNNDNVVCVYNSKNDRYYEDVHESFEMAEQRLYIKCSDYNAYQTFRNFVIQNSKYHEFIRYSSDIPYEKAYSKLFKDNNKEIVQDKKAKENYIEMTGKVLKIGNEFTKKDGDSAKFIELQQEYKYNGKTKYNKISVMIPKGLIESSNVINKSDKISIKGKLNTYNDKDNNTKWIINCSEIEVLDKNKDKNTNVDMEK